jgi:hypothetical protein
MSLTHSLTHTHTHTHACTHTHARARIHTHTHRAIICYGILLDVQNHVFWDVRTSNLATYLTCPATLWSHSDQESPHPSPCQEPFEPLVHQWSSLWNRELPMHRLFSQHSERCLVTNMIPVIQFKQLAYVSMLDDIFHQFCSTGKCQNQTSHTVCTLQGTVVLMWITMWDTKQNNESDEGKWQKYISFKQSLTDWLI